MNITTLELDNIYFYFIKLGHFIPTEVLIEEKLKMCKLNGVCAKKTEQNFITRHVQSAF